MIRAIRIRLYPTPDQKKYLAGLFGAVRFCFNKALYLKTRECQDFCVWGGYSRGSPTRLPFVFCDAVCQT